MQIDVQKSMGFAGWRIRTPEYETLAKSPVSSGKWEEWISNLQDGLTPPHLMSTKATAMPTAKEPSSAYTQR